MVFHHTAALSEADARSLRSTRIFSSLSDRHFHSLSETISVGAFSTGQPLFSEGDRADWLFVVLEGWVVLYRDRCDGERAVIHLFGPGESFAEALILKGARYPVSAEAASDLRIARIETARFRALVTENPELSLSIISATLRQLRNLVDHIEHSKGLSTGRRVAGFLVKLCRSANGSCRFDLPIEQRLIAARLAMTPATLSRTLSRLGTLGVDAKRGQITIQDVDRLARFANGDEA